MELSTVIHENPHRRAPAREDLVDQHSCDGRSSVIPHWKGFGPLGKLVNDCNHVFVATCRLWMRSRYINGDRFKRKTTAERCQRRLFWSAASMVLCTGLTALQLGLDLTFPAWPVKLALWRTCCSVLCRPRWPPVIPLCTILTNSALCGLGRTICQTIWPVSSVHRRHRRPLRKVRRGHSAYSDLTSADWSSTSFQAGLSVLCSSSETMTLMSGSLR